MVLNLRRLSGKSSHSQSDRRASQGSLYFSSSPTENTPPLPSDVEVAPLRQSRRWSRRTSSASHRSSTIVPSSPSRDSLLLGADESLCTESSGSTIPGPGVLTGRVIKALGNIAVVGIDNMLIKRKVSAYRNIFPHGRWVDETEDDGREMYSEILEFTRPGIYPSAVRKEAMELLMIQINIRETHQLMRTLHDDFHYDGLRAFLFQILDYDTQVHQASNTAPFAEGEAKFASSIPLAFFIFRLSFSEKKSHRVAVDSFLLAMCAEKSLLADHLLQIFKFGQDSDYLDKLDDYPPEERQTLWKLLGHLRTGELPYLEERLRSRTYRIDEILKQEHPAKEELRSVCSDLVEFSKSNLNHLVEGIQAWAFSRIFTCLAREGEYWEPLLSTLGRVPHGDQYRVMSRILHCTFPALNLSPSPSDHLLVEAYQQAFAGHTTHSDSSHDLQATIFTLFFRFVIQAFSTQGSLRSALMLDQHFLSIIIRCLSPPPIYLTSDDLLRMVTQDIFTR